MKMDADMMLNEKLKKIDDLITKKKMIMDGNPVIPFTSAEKMIAYEYPAIWFTYMSKFHILIFFLLDEINQYS
jgi:cullin 1